MSRLITTIKNLIRISADEEIILLLPMLVKRMRKAAAWVVTTAIVVPVADFLIVLSTNGSTGHLLIHGITALVMIANSFLLFHTNSQSLKG